MTSTLPRSGPPRPGRYTKYPAKPVYRGAPAQGCGAEYRRHRAPISLPRGSGPPATKCNYGVHAYQRVLMLRPLDTALDFECRPLQLLCFGVAALLGNSPTQTTHSSQGMPKDTSLKIGCLAV